MQSILILLPAKTNNDVCATGQKNPQEDEAYFPLRNVIEIPNGLALPSPSLHSLEWNIQRIRGKNNNNFPSCRRFSSIARKLREKLSTNEKFFLDCLQLFSQ